MSLERFELLELRHDDGVQTYHAREIATARPVQVHLFAEGHTPATLAIFRKLAYLPGDERRRVLDRGTYEGIPYLVTDRLAGFASVREWIERKSAPTVDEQFEELFESPAESPPEPPFELDPEPEPLPLAEIEPDPEPRTGSRAASIVGLILGVGAALFFLVLLIAFVILRPHRV